MHPVSCLEQGSTPGLPAVSRTRVHACVSPEPPLLTAIAGSSAPHQAGSPEAQATGCHNAGPGAHTCTGGSPGLALRLLEGQWEGVQLGRACPSHSATRGPPTGDSQGAWASPAAARVLASSDHPAQPSAVGKSSVNRVPVTPRVSLGWWSRGQDETTMSWGSGGPGIRARALRPAWVPSPSAVGAGTSSGLRGPLLPGTHPPAARPQAGGREEGRVV